MALQAIMSPQERADAARWAEIENRRLSQEIPQRTVDPSLGMGKDDFLKILITQLSYQDPTAPMQDREFIAQMAQFSTLEQMTNMSTDFNRMAQMLMSSEASSALGKSVEIVIGDQSIQGVVQAVTREEVPQILVGGRLYSWEQVTVLFDEN